MSTPRPASYSNLRILVSGLIVRQPLGGLAWHYAQYVMGLARLGHDVYFIEDSSDFPSCFDPVQHALKQARWRRGAAVDLSREKGKDPGYGLQFAATLFNDLGLGSRWAYYDAHTNQWHGPCGNQMPRLCKTADLLLNVSHMIKLRPWLQDIPVRALVDTDPAFSQLKYIYDPAQLDQALQHTAYFTFGTNYGRANCAIPRDGLPWRPTRQPIVLDAWPVEPGPRHGAFTTVMSWKSYPDSTHAGVRYGMKSDSFPPYLNLPKHRRETFEIGINHDEGVWSELRTNGWRLRDAFEVTETPRAYQRFIVGSKAEFTVAKHGYVVSRSGWFSERTAAYLACGRPAVTQETGFSDWLPTGTGLVSFSTPEEAAAAIDAVNADYRAHCRAARELASAYFDASTVLNRLVEEAMDFSTAPSDPASLPGGAVLNRYRRFVAALTALLPAATRFSLADDGQWSRAFSSIDGRLFCPFPEVDGLYWGRPIDAQAAINELERQRARGVPFLIFAPPAFWWLDHYKEFDRYLRTHFPCLQDDDLLLAFDLRHPTPVPQPLSPSNPDP